VLLLGGSGYRTAQLVTQQRAESDARWRELTDAADFPDAPRDDAAESLTLLRNG